MINLSDFNIQELSESIDLEVKLALGRDGKGQVPESFYETYSAMANTDGGVVLLGVNKNYDIIGILEPERIVDDIWNALNNPQKVSVNILRNNMIIIREVGDKKIIQITIPRATRKQRPVYLKGDYLRNTFRRNNSGDYVCDSSAVKRMLADQSDEPWDSRVLDKFTLSDIDPFSFKAYRNQFKSVKPDSPWLELDDTEFLKRVGGWGKDRESSREGLTVAGLLMFGRFDSIREVAPYYFVDYQEQAENKTEPRWTDRVVPDGTWSGNLFDFYRKVIQKLVQNLKIPFKLKDGVRVDETPVHEALREALINTLIHADYAGSASILIVKRPDVFGFRNPGTMRISVEEAIHGGVSDCRNRNLQQLFRFIGAGEKAGSGVPKIFKSWREQHWKMPSFHEKIAPPDYTILGLPMISFLPETAIQGLEDRFGPEFKKLDELQRLALATASLEGTVTNRRLRGLTSKHPVDISRELGELVKKRFLESGSNGRWTFYYLPGDTPKDPENTEENLFLAGFNSQHLAADSQHLLADSQHLKVVPGTQIWNRAKDIAAKVSGKGKAPEGLVKETILEICELGFCKLSDLAKLLDRDPATIRNHYLSKLIKENELDLQIPGKPNHPKQSYRRRIK